MCSKCQDRAGSEGGDSATKRTCPSLRLDVGYNSAYVRKSVPSKEKVMVVRRFLALVLSGSILLSTAAGFAQTGQSAASSPTPVVTETPEQLQQLVAPIALYPDALVAQILAAATYPSEVVEADRWMQQHSGLQGQELASEVDKQSWDPSVKALTQFPSVLANMDKNLSWTSSLGDAYVSQQQDVMKAVQVMRGRAKNAGNLNSNAEEKVTTQGQTIIIEPANPEVVYVPEYDPWIAYGEPLVAWPGWYPNPGLFIGGPGVAFGFGYGLGFFSGFGWGWHHWGSDWDRHRVIFDHDGYISHSRTFSDHNRFHEHGPDGGREFRGPEHGFNGPQHGFVGPQHGFNAPHSQPDPRSGTFGGFDHGGIAGGHSSRGRSSMGGGAGGFHAGGGFHGGGGGFHGGGGRR
jgi:uncharacterized membrane protein YgcG